VNETQVVFGANGALGAAIVRRLTADGKPVRAVVRDAELAAVLLPPTAGVVVKDARVKDMAMDACRGAAVVYYCINVPYNLWPRWMPTITDNIVAAASQAGASLVFPGNVYGYGPLQSVPATEQHPLAASSRKGQLRNAMERRLMRTHEAGDVPTVIPRFPDFYGPNVINKVMAPIFESALSAPSASKGAKAAWPGSLDVPHDLVFVDDAAAACVLLGATPEAYGEAWHVPGAGPLTGRQFLEMVFRAAGTPPRGSAMGRLTFRLLGLLAPEAKEMLELLYQFEQPMVLDGGKFARAFPDFRYTPHEDAVRQTVEWFRRNPLENAPTA
jgi:nucleoside-diphosphate-sugar epimerase